jgi:hypothetical protein
LDREAIASGGFLGCTHRGGDSAVGRRSGGADREAVLLLVSVVDRDETVVEKVCQGLLEGSLETDKDNETVVLVLKVADAVIDRKLDGILKVSPKDVGHVSCCPLRLLV